MGVIEIVPEVRRPLRLIGIAGGLALFFELMVLFCWLVRNLIDFLDIAVYRAGGQALLDGIPLYAKDFGTLSGTGYPFTYPPFAAILFVSLAVLPWVVAAAVVTGGSLLSLCGVTFAVARRRYGRTSKAAWFAGAATVIGLASEPVRETISYGQINLILMALVLADCLLPRTPWPRGMLIGIAAAIKLTPAYFVLFFLPSRQWRPPIVAGVTFVVATLIGWLAAPSATRAYWFGALGETERIGGPSYAGNQSLSGFVHRLDLDGAALPRLLWLLGAAAVTLICWRAVRRARAAGNPTAALLAVATAGLLASPVSWTHHWVWAVPAGLWVALRLHRRGRLTTIGFAAMVAVFLVAPQWFLPHEFGRELAWAPWQHLVGNVYVWLGLAFLIALAWRTYRRADEPADEPPVSTAHGNQSSR
ncbi:alpha-1,2-mannosyltransferase [Herbihabitans rhizosphaerae]|uniref:Alpha-1,2-mannosyltransferase n=1 Tax=Herbihabitans rhizosphaerae TaxID=1872711 RepID=A0A4Q7KCM4_9PSEU|nr:glycosyltransferase 87 family protein [Herbihabitans rhizosphaerae]RZS30385.1 alpha-1,2-mannosyltransferase [Herbihabitans rhizosphaerae]